MTSSSLKMGLADLGGETPTIHSRDRLTTFRFDEAITSPMAAGLPVAEASGSEIGESFKKLIAAGLDDGGTGKLLFSYGDDEDGFCLLYLWIKAHMVIPRHLHGQDCLYYIVSGEAIMGSQTLNAGDGFFVPAERPYAYIAGPNGVEVLEFRHVTADKINGVFLDSKPEPWERFLDVIRNNRAQWQTESVPPSLRAVARAT
jgi:mannose-6-phosphate isomerase-like protein (cupin superfamily)